MNIHISKILLLYHTGANCQWRVCIFSAILNEYELFLLEPSGGEYDHLWVMDLAGICLLCWVVYGVRMGAPQSYPRLNFFIFASREG